MLTYLINVTGDMLAATLLIGIILAFTDVFCSDKGKIIYRISLPLGVIAAGIRSYITNTQRLVGGWRVGTYGYGIALGLFVLTAVLFGVFGYAFFRKKGTKLNTAAEIVLTIFMGLLSIAYMYCALPNVLVYPFQFDSGDNGILSTEYLFRLGGYLLGIILSVVSAYAAYKFIRAAGKKGYTKLICALLYASNLIYAVFNFAKLMAVLTVRKIVDSSELFKFSAESNNKAHWYTFALFIMLIAFAVVFWIGSRTKKEAFSNKAQRRKLRSVWRSGKRSSVAVAVCFVGAILCPTWFVDLNTVVIREAPVEDTIVEKNSAGQDETLVVPIETVQDGHLHRFGYKTSEGSTVRFIVVLKQENTNNYGVGLDACEICGEAGYYENNNGQIVCKKCNVIMNRTTIGMKGGCNPIIIDYDIDESKITVPVSEMTKNQSHFK